MEWNNRSEIEDWLKYNLIKFIKFPSKWEIYNVELSLHQTPGVLNLQVGFKLPTKCKDKYGVITLYMPEIGLYLRSKQEILDMVAPPIVDKVIEPYLNPTIANLTHSDKYIRQWAKLGKEMNK